MNNRQSALCINVKRSAEEVSCQDLDDLSPLDQLLIAAIQTGLPLVSRPYAVIGERLGISETEVITRLSRLLEMAIIKRFGIVVRHRKLGYRANAMVVWDILDQQVTEIGQQLKQFDCVTLCYCRARCLPDWPYNLYCMIHGKDRNTVLKKLDQLIEQCQLTHRPYQVLFSRRCFKQRGAIYTTQTEAIVSPQPAIVVGR